MMEFLDLGKTPVSDEAPAGKDVRYEPCFEALAEEIAKLGSPTAVTGINWDTVVELSVQILQEESNHLQVASYLNYGLMKTRGLEGLYQGIHVLKELVENYWDTMFPPKKRMKGRKGIINWWSEKITDYVSETDPVIWEKEKRDTLIEELNFIDSFLGEKIDDAPLLLPLIRKIQGVIQEKEIEAAKVDSTPDKHPPAASDAPSMPQEKPAPQQTASNPGQASAAPAPIAPEKDADTSALLAQGLGILGKAASGLRNENWKNPLSYRLNRIVAWSTIDELPSATGGKTMIPPPDSQIFLLIGDLYDSQNWEALADSCEGKVKQFLFWLDLSRYVAESMEHLGHGNVAKAIESETALFIQTLNGVEQLSFSDGTPFADDATKVWLKQIQSGDAGWDGMKPVSEADGINRTISEKAGEAQQLIREKKLDNALSLFKEQLLAATSVRERFLWKIELCRILISSKQIVIASSYIDDILNNIDTYQLEAWEPEAALEALAIALTGLRLQQNSDHEQRIESIIKRISMLDPVKALQII